MIWFKHPLQLLNDKRLASLIDKEGSKGYGMYMYIIEMLGAQPDHKLSFSQLSIISRKGFPKRYMVKIVREYKLFHILGEEFESVIPFFRPDIAQQSSDNLKTSAKTESVENDDKQLKNSDNAEKTALARVREEKKRVEENRRKDNVVVQKNDDDNNDNNSHVLPKERTGIVRIVLLRSERHIPASRMPRFSPPNATLPRAPSVAFYLAKCGVSPPEVWHFTLRSVDMEGTLKENLLTHWRN